MRLSIFPRTGGKNGQIAEAIASAIPSNGIETYIEPFGGSFGVGAHLMCPYPTEIYNDLDPYCYATMKAFVMDGMGLLGKMYKETEYSRDYFETAKKIVLSGFDGISDPLEQGKYAYTVLLQSFNGNSRNFRTDKSGIFELEYREKILNKFGLIDRMKNVQVLQVNALDLISEHKDSESTLIYLDPPYTKKDSKQSVSSQRLTMTNLYIHDMETSDQELLLEKLQNSKAKIILSGYHNSLYESTLTPDKGWYCYDILDVYKTSKTVDSFSMREMETEVIWTNYPVISIK